MPRYAANNRNFVRQLAVAVEVKAGDHFANRFDHPRGSLIRHRPVGGNGGLNNCQVDFVDFPRLVALRIGSKRFRQADQHIVGVAVGIYHLASHNMAHAIANHDRTDSEGDEAKIAAVLHGAAAITGAQANGQRQQVAAEALGLKLTQMTMREANRLAEERSKKTPPGDDDLLKQLLGGDEPLLLTEGDDE